MVARRHINIWRRMPDHYLCGGRRWLDAVQFGSQEAKKPRDRYTHFGGIDQKVAISRRTLEENILLLLLL